MDFNFRSIYSIRRRFSIVYEEKWKSLAAQILLQQSNLLTARTLKISQILPERTSEVKPNVWIKYEKRLKQIFDVQLL